MGLLVLSLAEGHITFALLVRMQPSFASLILYNVKMYVPKDKILYLQEKGFGVTIISSTGFDKASIQKYLFFDWK